MGPARNACVESFEEAGPVPREDLTPVGGASRERLEDGPRHRPRVGGVEPVVGVAEAVHVGALLALDLRRLDVEEIVAAGQVVIPRAVAAASKTSACSRSTYYFM